MKKVIVAALATAFTLATTAAFAQASGAMSGGEMASGTMAKEPMSKDSAAQVSHQRLRDFEL
jgi:pentapeptide MXKDX repeat protein